MSKEGQWLPWGCCSPLSSSTALSLTPSFSLQSNKVPVVQPSHGVHPLTPLIPYSNDHFSHGSHSPHLPADISQKQGNPNCSSVGSEHQALLRVGLMELHLGLTLQQDGHSGRTSRKPERSPQGDV